jgi:hypothetical protein
MFKNFFLTIATYAYWLVALVYTARGVIHLAAADILVAALYATMGYTLNKDAHGPRYDEPPKTDQDTPSPPRV